MIIVYDGCFAEHSSVCVATIVRTFYAVVLTPYDFSCEYISSSRFLLAIDTDCVQGMPSL